MGLAFGGSIVVDCWIGCWIVAVDIDVVLAIAEDSGVVVAEVAGVLLLSLLAVFTDIRRGVFSPRRLSSLEDEFEVDIMME